MAERRPMGGVLCKRGMDVLFAGCGLIALAPIMAIVALAIRVTMGQPILYRQMRPGLHGRPFEILKFRTMRNAQDVTGKLLRADERVTRLGYWLRRTSIDELPELLNVLTGDMSLVGPRPLMMEYLPRYSSEQVRRHEVKPGLTGLAQVQGRHELGWDERFRLDVWYVDHWSIRLDVEIIVATPKMLLRGQGQLNPDSDDFYFMGAEGRAGMGQHDNGLG